MKDNQLLDAIGGIDEKFIQQAQGKRTPWHKWGALAACVAIVATVCIWKLPKSKPTAPTSPTQMSDFATPSTDPNHRGGYGDDPTSPTQMSDFATPSTDPNYRGGYGDDLKSDIALNAANAEQLRAEYITDSPLPVFRDEYPIVNSGLLFDVTQEMLNAQASVGKDFLEFYYGSTKKDVEFVTRTYAEHLVWYEDTDIEVSVSPWSLNLRPKERIEKDLSSDELLELPIIKGAIQWKKIQTPIIREKRELCLDGSEFWQVFTIAEYAEDSVQQAVNFARDKIIVTICPNVFSIRISLANEPQISTVGAITKAQLDDYLARTLSETPEDYLVELFYKSPKSETIVPYFRFYLPKSDYAHEEGYTVYSVIEVASEEILADIDIKNNETDSQTGN